VQDGEPDIIAPFQNAVTPSRICGAYNNGIYRVCMDTIIRGTQATNDYWFHEKRRRWTGPHSFPYDCASPYGNYFILCSNASTAVLYKSQAVADTNTVYVELGVQLTSTLQSATFPKTQKMSEKQVIESTIELSSSGAATSYAITAQDDQQNTIDNTMVAVSNTGTLWGTGVWGGSSTYQSSTNRPTTYTVPWTIPLVFKKMALLVTGSSTSALAIGTFFARYQDLGYVNRNLL
jgi:hypothetical protein